MIKTAMVSKAGKFLFNRRIVKDSDVIFKTGDTFTGELVLCQVKKVGDYPVRLVFICEKASSSEVLEKLETMARVGKLSRIHWYIASFNSNKVEHTLLWGNGYFPSIDVFPNPDIYFSFSKDSAKK